MRIDKGIGSQIGTLVRLRYKAISIAHEGRRLVTPAPCQGNVTGMKFKQSEAARRHAAVCKGYLFCCGGTSLVTEDCCG